MMKLTSFLLLLVIVPTSHIVTGFFFFLPTSTRLLPSALSFRPIYRQINDDDIRSSHQLTTKRQRTLLLQLSASSSMNDNNSNNTTNDDSNNKVSTNIIDKAPSLNGKIILPLKAILVGLGQHKVAAVYAILQNYNKNEEGGSSSSGGGVEGGDGWEKVVHIGITKDLSADITTYLKQNSNENKEEEGGVSSSTSSHQQQQKYHVRALSFSYPQKSVMAEFANTWRIKVQESKTRSSSSSPIVATTVGEKYNDEDDEDDDDDMDEDELDDYLQMMAGARAAVSSSSSTLPPPLFVDQSSVTTAAAAIAETYNVIISPFEAGSSNNNIGDTTTTTVLNTTEEEELPLELTLENVDMVLNEVRPYLISDGGNVSVQRIDNDDDDNNKTTTKRNVYLVLEGACGSCASSTVTMKMGIERVLREKFGTVLGEVVQVDPNDNDSDGDSNSGDGNKTKGKATELTIDAVQAEVDRMAGAIAAMGGVVRIVNVDPIGVVTIDYRGPNRVKRGLELALLDVEYVKHVKFVS
jgi:Fe-S cluster biogenesis protein NfuA